MRERGEGGREEEDARATSGVEGFGGGLEDVGSAESRRVLDHRGGGEVVVRFDDRFVRTGRDTEHDATIEDDAVLREGATALKGVRVLKVHPIGVI